MIQLFIIFEPDSPSPNEYCNLGSWKDEEAFVPAALHREDDLRRVHLLQQPREGRLPHRQDHQPGHPQLQEIHHGKWQLDHLGSGEISSIVGFSTQDHNLLILLNT